MSLSDAQEGGEAGVGGIMGGKRNWLQSLSARDMDSAVLSRGRQRQRL